AHRGVDARSHAAEPLRRTGELGQPVCRVLRRVWTELESAEIRLSLLQPVGAWLAVLERVQALRFIPTAVADAGQRGVPELSRSRASHTLEHRPDDPLCGGLQRTVHTWCAGDSEPDAGDLRARSHAAGKRLLRAPESARSRLPEDFPDRAVSVLRSGGHLQ